ncbi:hypothetical protein S58_35030 [Bradyrhizobium oligotrophicum S58]|uniref:T6SS Phospholipase effector Tle1-like catalytic domain-containing protein n=1 Tax=Bradyrhizobium oligotrophicum S58 TaxID=1245469 RepID=M4Z8I2_9BRAD|nr:MULTISPECIES: DUF2235 domain-containing protein [Bradyrhizobium]BAM89496.1 hypothetical protein S58_35030 [Bradyrhizobium oligotrophicum S58]
MPDGDEALSSAPESTEGLPTGRKIVLFVDGTGNAFSTQESNIWRLYEALDRTQTDQIAYYIKGVGTAGWRPWAILDGATGIGVPGNVRTLYRFLCWNWRPSDQIYIFGFSRGAFTARTLAALIASEGFVPAEIDDTPVSHKQMQRYAMAAWRNYRSKTIPWTQSLPTIWIARAVRDIVVRVLGGLRKDLSYAELRSCMGAERRDVRIAFIGLFDTVEAFGVPIEELRGAIDWAIWPISFRNRVLSDKVRRARHALSLDDERATFQPIRFDRSKEVDPARIVEVWFSGVHSDVGGGYPDGTLSYVPLVWMTEQLGSELRFQPGQIERFCAYQSPLGPMHDSRSGPAVLYRYSPRVIGDGEQDGGPPVVDHSVVERMQRGCDNYAPIMLPANAKVLMPSGEVVAMTDRPQRAALRFSKAAHHAEAAGTAAAIEAVSTMPAPNQEMAEQACDTVFWRRVAYFALLWLLGAIVAWPLIAESLEKQAFVGRPWLSAISNGISSVIASAATMLAAIVPSYLTPWLNAARTHPLTTMLIVLGAIAAWRAGSFLRDRIQERARLAWNRPGRNVADPGRSGVLLRIARFVRKSAAVRSIYWFVTTLVFPGLFLLLIACVALVWAGRGYFNWQAGAGRLCRSESFASPSIPATPITEAVSARRGFDIKSLCWSTGLAVEKGLKYRIWISIREPWFDRTIMSGVGGFQISDVRHLAALPMLRNYGANWFQPVLRIGSQSSTELPLVALNGMAADRLPRTAPDGTARPIHVEDIDHVPAELGNALKQLGWFNPIPLSALPAAREIWKQQDFAETMVAEFVAPDSGELFLYVNDAVQIFPIGKPFELFYDNNSGSADIQVQRLPLPPPPQ